MNSAILPNLTAQSAIGNVQAAVKSRLGEIEAKLTRVALHPRTLREIREISEEIVRLTAVTEAAIGFDWSNYELTKSERKICAALYRRLGREVSVDQLYASLYEGEDSDPDPKIIDVLLCKIRPKLDFFECPYAIQTSVGIGYKMVERSEYRRYLPRAGAAAVAKPYVPMALRVPIKKQGQRVYVWEGVRMGAALATMAMKLKGANGAAVPISELGPKRGPVQVQIHRLRKKMAGKYKFQLVSECDSYVMVSL